MRQSGRYGDLRPGARSVIACILIEPLSTCRRFGRTPNHTHVVWPNVAGLKASLRRSQYGTLSLMSLRELYRGQANPPVHPLEFSNDAFDVPFDAAHELTILMHGLSRSTP